MQCPGRPVRIQTPNLVAHWSVGTRYGKHSTGIVKLKALCQKNRLVSPPTTVDLR